MFIGTLIRLGVEEIETMAMVCVVAVRVCRLRIDCLWPSFCCHRPVVSHFAASPLVSCFHLTRSRFVGSRLMTDRWPFVTSANDDVIGFI